MQEKVFCIAGKEHCCVAESGVDEVDGRGILDMAR
jgi:hypothetical protein